MGREHWVEVELSKLLVSLESGSRPKGGVKGISDGVPSIGAEHLNYEGGFNFEKIRFIPTSFAKGMKRGIIKPFDILIVKDGATTGKTSFVDVDFPFKYGCVNEHVFICRAIEFLNVKHLFYYLRSQEGQELILATFHGAAQGGISSEFIDAVRIPLPPLAEQQRIVEKLDAILPRIKAAKERLEKVPAILKRFRQSVLAAACSGRLTEDWREENNFENNTKLESCFSINEEYRKLKDIPEKWNWTALGNYVKCNRGRFSIRPRNDPRYFGGEIPFIQIGDLPREGGYINSHVQTLNNDGLKVSKMFPKNTVVIAIVGATIGNTGILGYNMCFTDSMVGINTGNLSLNLYIDFYLRLEKENLRRISYAGGGQPNIKLELLNEYPIPLPPIEEQLEIVRRVEKLFTLADSLEAKYNLAMQRIEKIEQAVLAKAFRGELAAQDPNDEPAEALLQRILAEKEKLAGHKPGKAKRASYKEATQPGSMAAESAVNYKKRAKQG